MKKNVDNIYLDDNCASRECVNDGYGPQCSGGMPVDGAESNGEDDERNVVMKSDLFFVGQKFHMSLKNLKRPNGCMKIVTSVSCGKETWGH